MDTRYTTETNFRGTTIRCTECRARAVGTPAFPRAAADVKHSPTCSAFVAVTPSALVVTAAQVEAAKAGGVSHSGLTEDQIVEAVATGRISRDDAMNRDY